VSRSAESSGSWPPVGAGCPIASSGQAALRNGHSWNYALQRNNHDERLVTLECDGAGISSAALAGLILAGFATDGGEEEDGKGAQNGLTV